MTQIVDAALSVVNGANGTQTYTVPTGVTSGMYGLFVLGTSSATAPGYILSSPGVTFTLLDTRAAVNSNITVYTATGLVAGAVITFNATTSTAFTMFSFYQDQFSYAAISPGVRSVSSASCTSGALTGTSGQPMVIVSTERTTATGTTVSSAVSSGSETVTQIGYLENTSQSNNSHYFGQFTASASASRTATVTYNSASTNGYTAILSTTSLTTSVSSDSDLRWAEKAQLNSDSDLRWAVRGSLNSDVDHRWAVRSVVLSDTDQRWAVRAVLLSQSDQRWAVRGSLSSDSDLRWAVVSSITTVSSDVDLRWATRVILLSQSDFRWAVRNVLTSDVDGRWVVRSVALSDLDGRWRVRSMLLSDLSLVWAVRGRTTSDSDFRWVSRAWLIVDMDLRWVSLSLVVPVTYGVAQAGPGGGPVAQAGAGSSLPVVLGSDVGSSPVAIKG